MVKILKKHNYTILVVIFIFTGFLFRLKGIQDGHSFWSDEAFVSAIARNINRGGISAIEGIEIIIYQPLQTIITLVSFIIFGFSEFAARIPAVIFGTIGIIFAYLLGSKLSNKNGGLLSAFLYSFSQLNLANSTQAKPYTAIQTLLVAICYTIILLQERKKKYISLHIFIILAATASTLFNYIGILTWIPYLIYFGYSYKKRALLYLKQPHIIFFGGIFFILGVFFLQIPKMISTLFDSQTVNNTTYLRELLWRNYAFITLPAIIGIVTMFKKNKPVFIGVSLYILSLLMLWNFKQYSHNVRYLVPLFGLLFVLFGVFWAEVGERLFNKKSAWVCLLVAVLLFAGGYKIVRKPAVYYSPNADLLGDVQIADYKTAYMRLNEKYPDLKNIAVFNDVIDTEIWYMDKQANAYFMKGVVKPYPNPADHTMIYGTLNDFIKQKNKYPKGILIVEDWESFLPEDIKQYAKKNMKLEFRVEGLPQAEGDNWPIEVYSWGL
jgi:4-amino-4-deoxy-L-arabinose transferase-like glycosyltransferase